MQNKKFSEPDKRILWAVHHSGRSMLTGKSCSCEQSDLQGWVAQPVNTDLNAAGGQRLEGGPWLLAKGRDNSWLDWRERQAESTALSLGGFLQTKTNTLPHFPRSPLGVLIYFSAHSDDDQPITLCLRWAMIHSRKLRQTEKMCKTWHWVLQVFITYSRTTFSHSEVFTSFHKIQGMHGNY